MRSIVILFATALIFGTSGCNKDHCDDGKHNQDETGVDCGGLKCKPCEDCFDGIKNQGETEVDCGGPCKACDLKWAQVRSGTHKLKSIDYYNNVVVAVGSNGLVVKSSDLGKTWSELTSGTTEELMSVHVLDESNYFVCGNSDLILVSKDGNSFSSYNTTKSSNWKDIYFYHPDSGVVCGSKMRIMFTDDGGKSWTERVLPKPTSAYSFITMNFLNADEGYAIGGTELLRTLDGGKNWSPIDAFRITEDFKNFTDIHFKTTSDVYCITESGMFISRNSVVWADKLLDVGGGKITFNKQMGLYTGRNSGKSEGKVLISSDGGIRWQNQVIDNSIEFTDGLVISEDVMLAVGDKGSIFRRDK
ncbi:MAG: hypothetical protein CL840_07965 [Crocinitomicaceae bacterium]|nr:hypothetical protein [Crocinitomicaceae bacterium]|tara:strand:+ start:10789 stop:11868 length:1080 start_codon:yes stop_codon:yes gene_type:complete